MGLTNTQTGSNQSSAAETETLQPFLFLVVQGDALRTPAMRIALSGVDRVAVGRGDARGFTVKSGPDGLVVNIAIADDRVSKAHCEVRREGHDFVLADLASKNGTRVDGVPQKQQSLSDGAVLEVGRTFFLFRRHRARPGQPPVVEVDASQELPGLATLIPALQRQLADLRSVAPSGVPVLIRGETGTGKELAAAALHALSGRRGAFVPVNCGALPASLGPSELLGAKRGAFSGATEDRVGLVRAADKGTLFLDEIGDLSPDVQAVLLRVLQEGEVLSLGATKPVKVDARIVAATHRDLEAMVASGDFREDLLARLAGYTVRQPALRVRREDLGLLVAGILQRRLGARQVSLRNVSVRRLFSAPFERNTRELEQALVAAATLSAGRELELELDDADSEAVDAARDADLKARLEAALRTHKGNVTAVAAELGKARMQIQRWMKRFRLERKAPAVELKPEAGDDE